MHGRPTEDDLAALSSILDSIIVHNRFLSNVIYIIGEESQVPHYSIGTSALVALNPTQVYC